MLGDRVAGASFLDLFCGSGANGIEALSRGAAHCVFVDKSRECEAALRRNLEHTKLAARSRVMIADFLSAMDCLAAERAAFDIVFIDPPYSAGLAARALGAAARLLRAGALVVVEEAYGAPPPGETGLELIKQKRYGAAGLYVYSKE